MQPYLDPIKLGPSQRRARYTVRKLRLALLALFVAGGFVAADKFGFFGHKVVPDGERYDEKRFRVVHVVDGDTIDLDVADGITNRPHTRVRLWAVDTPETKKPETPPAFYGQEASDFVTRQVLNKTVTIQLEGGKKSRDKYNRLLAWVVLSDGRLLNRVLVQEGYGFADPRFPHHLDKEFKHLQAGAMNSRRGLWVKGPPADIPEYYRNGRYPLPSR